MRVLVCGGRDYGIIPLGCPYDQIVRYRERTERESFFLRETLDCLHAKEPIVVLIHGGASGADALAATWALRKGVKVLMFKARWRQLGRRAGPVRNRLMLEEGQPDLVVGFPGGDGTANMISLARAAGVPVFEAGI